MSDERFDRIDQRFEHVDERFERIDDWQKRADQRFDRIETRIEYVNQRVGVLHEDVLTRIAATGEARLPTKREMDERFDELRELIERRIDPVDAAIRLHSQEIAALKKKRR